MSQWLILLAMIPLSCLQLTKYFNTRYRWMLCGMSFGAVIAPVSLGLLQFTYIPVIGKLLGIIGLIANLTHGSLGYFCLVGSGLLQPGMLISSSQLIMINVINGVLFALCYGMIGYSIDKKLEGEKEAVSVRIA